jgi:hypothetical protein
MASNHGYKNIPASQRANVIQAVSTDFSGVEQSTALGLADILFSNLVPQAAVTGAAAQSFIDLTGTASKATFATGSATATQVAQRLMALEAALKAAKVIS